MAKEKIYIQINPAFPDYLKIGITRRTADLRAKELSSFTGVPGKYHVVYEEKVNNYKLVENIVHKRLENYRIPKKEFFVVPLKLAIKTINDVIEELDKHQTLEFDFKGDDRTWWDSLENTWKQVLKSQVKISYRPSDSDLLEAISSIIFEGQNQDLRILVIDLIKLTNFKTKLRNWYEKLSNHNKALINTYINFDLTETELNSIISLKKVDCSKTEIEDLSPIIRFENIEYLDCDSTNISDLEPLSHLTNTN